MTSKSNFAAMTRAILIALCVATCVVGFSLGTRAQSIFATLTGTVTDSSGAVVPNAKITIQNAGSKVARSATTNSAGYFSFPQLPTGTYNVVAEAQGFEKWRASSIVLQSSDDKSISVTLKIGAATETVEVDATAGEVAVISSGEKSTDISSKELQDLSLTGRNATEFLKILPGASLASNGGVNKPAYSGQVVGINGFCAGNGCNAGGLSGVSINGQTGGGVGISQDGQNVFDPGAPGAATPVNPNPDMISEVKVLTSNFSAENPIGPVVVNTVTKSGGSTFHGEGYFYARNSATNANDAFNKNPTVNVPRPNESYYYPGFNIGGPVIIPGTGFNKSRQKLFFFEGYENYHQRLDGGVDRAFVPTADMLNGDFSTMTDLQPTFGTTFDTDGNAIHRARDVLYNLPTTPSSGFPGIADQRAGCAITGGILNAACIDPIAQAYLKNEVPAANVDPLTHGGFNYIGSFIAPQNSYQNVVRGDWDISANNKAYITWSRQRETANMPTGLWVGAADWSVPTPTGVIAANASDAVTATFVHVFSPTMTAEGKFGYTKINFPNSLQDPSKVLKKDSGFPLNGIYGNPDVPAMTSWGDSMPTYSNIGNDFHPNMVAVKGIPSTSGNLTKVYKSHTTKFGYFYEHTYNKQDNWGQYMGIFAYASWAAGPTGNQYADSLMGMGYGSFAETALPPPSEIAQNISAFYAQDDWKITRRITIQYGMRFEHYAKPYDASGFGMAVFNPALYQSQLAADPSTVNPGVSWHALDHSIPLSGAESRLFYFSPRIGAAIDIFGNGKTILRGGWGKYRTYDSVQSHDYTDPAGTSLGAVTFSCNGNSTGCSTWEDLDSHAVTPVFGHPVLNGNSFGVVNPNNDEQPLVTSYSLSVDQQLPSKMRLELSYVGNHTDFTQAWVNSNSVPFGAMVNAQVEHPTQCTKINPDPPHNVLDNRTDAGCENLYRPFPGYSAVNTAVTAGKAQYDALQVSLRRNVGWLTLQANYAFSKALGVGTQVANGGLTGSLPDYGVHNFYGVLPLDRAHVFNIAYVFNLPSTHLGNKLVRGLANGWQISGITQVESGAQMTAVSQVQGNGFLNFQLSDPLNPVQALGTPDVTLYPQITCNPTQGRASGQYLNPNCFGPAPVGQFGTAGLPYMAGPMYWNTDLTFIKNIKLTERQNLQFRFAMFDPLNHSLPSFNGNDANLKLAFGSGSNTTSNATDSKHPCPGPTCQAFGYADYAFGHRVLELGVKYSF